MNERIIIFYRNPELGKVKTRLAKTTGDARALAVYYALSNHTRSITESLRQKKAVYYSEHVDREDSWSNTTFDKARQTGFSLGERMMNALEESFISGFAPVAIIGTDCFELTTGIIEAAFEKLTTCDVVLGPAHDGGYYLIGLKKLYRDLFMNKTWSSDQVFRDTLEDCSRLNLTVSLLPTLKDVDTEEDLPPSLIG